jgi:hypothetical protein
MLSSCYYNYNVTIMLLSCNYHATIMLLSCYTHLLSWYYHSTIKGISCYYHAPIMLVSCYYVGAMPPTWERPRAARPGPPRRALSRRASAPSTPARPFAAGAPWRRCAARPAPARDACLHPGPRSPAPGPSTADASVAPRPAA